MSVLERLIALYAPHTCVACGAEGDILCRPCSHRLLPSAPQCYRCHAPSPSGRTCASCRAGSPLISVNVVTDYRGAAKDVLWSLKFDRAQAAAQVIGTQLADTYGSRVTTDTLVVPVPTATKRVRKRGYDQAVLIARAFAKQAGCQYAPLLVRHGVQEQKGAGRQQRYQQLRGVFTAKNNRRIPGSRIILIDDVLTTGATLEEAARTLQAGGARAIGALAFARA